MPIIFATELRKFQDIGGTSEPLMPIIRPAWIWCGRLHPSIRLRTGTGHHQPQSIRLRNAEFAQVRNLRELMKERGLAEASCRLVWRFGKMRRYTTRF